MEIGHLKQHLYPRAVLGTVEGSLRQAPASGDEAQVNPATARQRTAQQSPAQQHAAQQAVAAQARASGQEPLRSAHSEPESEQAGAMLAASLGEKLLQARQTRSTPRRGYTPDAMLSSTGKRAHASYQQSDRMPSARYVDELV